MSYSPGSHAALAQHLVFEGAPGHSGTGDASYRPAAIASELAGCSIPSPTFPLKHPQARKTCQPSDASPHLNTHAHTHGAPSMSNTTNISAEKTITGRHKQHTTHKHTNTQTHKHERFLKYEPKYVTTNSLASSSDRGEDIFPTL